MAGRCSRLAEVARETVVVWLRVAPLCAPVGALVRHVIGHGTRPGAGR